MVTEIDVAELANACTTGAHVIDVREMREFSRAHVPCAQLVPMSQVPKSLNRFPSDQRTYVICATGNRSMQVCRFLQEQGLDAVNVRGGTQAWVAAGLPVQRGAA